MDDKLKEKIEKAADLAAQIDHQQGTTANGEMILGLVAKAVVIRDNGGTAEDFIEALTEEEAGWLGEERIEEFRRRIEQRTRSSGSPDETV